MRPESSVAGVHGAMNAGTGFVPIDLPGPYFDTLLRPPRVYLPSADGFRFFPAACRRLTSML
jgi:hypothetical protein